MSTDETREALTAMVREGEAAGMYAADHGAAGFCTDHAKPPGPTTVAEDEETTGPWTCAHCGATGEGPKPHCVQLARIINGYDRTPAEQRAAAAEAERDALAVEIERLRAVGPIAWTFGQQARADRAEATVARVEALRSEIVATARGEHISMVRLANLRAAVGLAVTDTPTGAHLRVLPRERYDAVLDSGPTDPDETGRWYVACGCDYHGDHLGCVDGCTELGCVHPVGVEVSASTEAEAAARRGLPVPGETETDMVAQQAEAQRLCDEDRRYEDEGADCG